MFSPIPATRSNGRLLIYRLALPDRAHNIYRNLVCDWSSLSGSLTLKRGRERSFAMCNSNQRLRRIG